MSWGSFWNLPEELTLNILSRLPAKSVGMCRCVSKPWRALLSQPQFIRAHLQRSINARRHSLTFWDPDRWSLCYVSLSNAHQHQVLDKITLFQPQPIFPGNCLSFGFVAGSSHGLLLVSLALDDYYMSKKMLVLNPITRQSIQVPHPSFCLSTSKTYNDFTKFGYDPVDNDYKVVSIYFYDTLLDEDGNDITPDYAELVVHVYSLKTGRWIRPQTSLYYHSYQDMKSGPQFVHGCLNWIARRTADQEPVVVGFHLVEERFFGMPPPTAIDDDICDLVVIDGCLCMYDRNCGVDLWMMKEYGVEESWTKFTITYPDNSPQDMQFMFSVDEEDVVMRYGEVLVMYNLNQGSFKDMELLGSARQVHFSEGFVESLVSP